jgi:hypothetical protein
LQDEQVVQVKRAVRVAIDAAQRCSAKLGYDFLDIHPIDNAVVVGVAIGQNQPRFQGFDEPLPPPTGRA